MAGYEGRYRETVKGFGSGEASSDVGGSSVAEIIQSLDGDLVAFRGCVQSVGTQFDDQQNRTELKRLRGVIKDKLQSADTELRNARKNGGPQSKMIVDRQAKQLEGHMSTFKELLQKEKASTQQNPLDAGIVSVHSSTPTGGDDRVISPESTQTQSQQMRGLELREREAAELQDLERDILDLNAIQTDIAQLVNEQGDDIDLIEVRTEQAQGRVEHGRDQTEQAVELKRKNVKLKLIIGGIVAGVAITLVVILIIVLAVVLPRQNN